MQNRRSRQNNYPHYPWFQTLHSRWGRTTRFPLNKRLAIANKEETKTVFDELLGKIPAFSVIAYTDGSVSDDKLSVSCAIHISTWNVSKSWRLVSGSSIFSAELQGKGKESSDWCTTMKVTRKRSSFSATRLQPSEESHQPHHRRTTPSQLSEKICPTSSPAAHASPFTGSSHVAQVVRWASTGCPVLPIRVPLKQDMNWTSSRSRWKV